MKTQILRLEPHDDLASIRDKLSWKQVGRIMLVLPGKGDAGLCSRLDNRLHLRLIQREAVRMGAQIALITTHAGLTQTARDCGLSVFPSVKQAHGIRWKNLGDGYHPSASRCGARSRTGYLPRRLLVSRQVAIRRRSPTTASTPPRNGDLPAILLKGLPWLAAALVALTALYLVLPRAEISISLPRRTQSLEIQVNASESVDRVDIRGRVPLTRVSGLIERESSQEALSRATFAERAATGILVLRNNADKAVSLPAGTRFFTHSAEAPSRRIFLLEKDIELAGLSPENGVVSAPVSAAQPGTAGNLPAGYYFSLEDAAGAAIVATNPEPMSGGTDASHPTPGEPERTALKRRLYAMLEDAAREALERQYGASDGLLIADSLKIKRVLSERFTPASEHAPAAMLNLAMQAEYEAFVVRAEDLQHLAELALEANLPAGSVAGGPPVISMNEDIKEENGDYRFSFRCNRELRDEIDQNALISAVAGKSLVEANAALRTRLPGGQTEHIRLTPAWWPRLPLFAYQITLHFE